MLLIVSITHFRYTPPIDKVDDKLREWVVILLSPTKPCFRLAGPYGLGTVHLAPLAVLLLFLYLFLCFSSCIFNFLVSPYVRQLRIGRLMRGIYSFFRWWVSSSSFGLVASRTPAHSASTSPLLHSIFGSSRALLFSSSIGVTARGFVCRLSFHRRVPFISPTAFPSPVMFCCLLFRKGLFVRLRSLSTTSWLQCIFCYYYKFYVLRRLA